MARATEDLPQPLSPTSAKVSPGRMSKLTAFDGVDAVGDAAEEAAAQVEGDVQVGDAGDGRGGRDRGRRGGTGAHARHGGEKRAGVGLAWRREQGADRGLLDHAALPA